MFSKLFAISSDTCVCPDCGTRLGEEPNRGAQVITCKQCGTKASVAEWTHRRDDPLMVGRADCPPSATKILRESTPEGTVWHIPASGKFGFFLFFGLFWCSITAIISGGFLVGFLTGAEFKGEGPTWLLVPFFSIFWIIGLTTLYFAARRKWMKHRLTVAHGELVLRREMFGRSQEKSLQVSEIQKIEQKEFYQHNDEPVYGIEIKGAHGKLRFGSGLDAAEKAWLVADLREVVMGPLKPAPDLLVEAPPTVTSNEAFSLEIPHGRKHLWPVALVFAVFGAICIVVSVTFLNEPWQSDPGEGPIFVRVFDAISNAMSHGMQAMFFLVGLGFFVVGMAVFIHLIRFRHNIQKLEGNSLEIAIRNYRHHLVWKEEVYPREQISDIRAPNSGSSGGTVMKRLELIAGNEVIKITGWIDADAADAVVAKVRPCL